MPHIINQSELPNSPNMEKLVISSFLLSDSMFNKFSPTIKPEMFYNDFFVKLVEYMQKNHCNEPGILMERFNDDRHIIVEIMERMNDSSKPEFAINELKRLFKLRKIVEIGMDMYNSSSVDYDVDIDKLLGKFQMQIATVNADSNKQPRPIGEILPEFFSELENNSNNGGMGLKTGLVDVDETAGGFNPGELIIIAARPSMGKSSLGLNILRHNGIVNNLPVLIFTLEMSDVMTSGRILFSEAMESYEEAINGKLPKFTYPKIAIKAGEIHDSPIIIDDTPAITLGDLMAKSYSVKSKYGLSMIMIDHLQLMNCSLHGKSRNEELSTVSSGLKCLAMELKVPVIAMSQLSRKCEEREDKRPMLSDLRESGALEQDADKVIMLYRDEWYNPTTENAGKAEIIIAKNRNGRTGKRETVFDGRTMQFLNLTKIYSDDDF